MGPPWSGSTVALCAISLVQRLPHCLVIYLLGWGPPGGQGPQGLELLPSDCRHPVLEILAQNFPVKNVPRSECAGFGGVL